MVFSRDYLVHYYEADAMRYLTLPSLVQYFEDIAILHSGDRGMDLEFFKVNHCGWMLLKWDIQVERLPLFGEMVGVSTEVHAMKSFLADRVFRMTAGDGSLLATARSNWLLVDTDRRRPMRIPANQYGQFGLAPGAEAEFVAIDEVPPLGPEGEALPDDAGSARALQSGELLRSTVRTYNSDIDTNGHVNNVRYIDWALDALPEDFLPRHVPTGIRVQYRKELSAGSEAEMVSAVSPMHTVSRHWLRGASEEYCGMEIRWKER